MNTDNMFSNSKQDNEVADKPAAIFPAQAQTDWSGILFILWMLGFLAWPLSWIAGK